MKFRNKYVSVVEKCEIIKEKKVAKAAAKQKEFDDYVKEHIIASK